MNKLFKKTNELKSGTVVRLQNGAIAVILDNIKGTRRRVRVSDPFVDEGSIWAHKIIEYRDEVGIWHPIVHTKDQLKTKEIYG